MKAALLIGFGNTLRKDDGVGPVVARRFVSREGLEVIETVQLLPEHIDAVANAGRVVLVDAGVNLAPGEVRYEKLEPATAERTVFDLHEMSPAGLLAAARDLYGRCPEVWLVTIGVADLDYGETLSPEVEAAVDEAVRGVEGLFSEE